MHDIWTWFLAPIDAGRPHDISILLSWHARLMVVAWGVLVPVAVLAARYYKITPRQKWPEELDNPFWWKLHWKGQTIAFLLSVLALALILADSGVKHAATLHRVLGYIVLGFAAAQVASGLLRGSKGGPTAPAPDGSLSGDHYDMTRRRLVFEAFHRTVGSGLVFLAVATIVLGLWAANAPRWMWLMLAVWWLLLLAVLITLQKVRGAADTYQAIWGPDPAHPGNRIKKQGWGTFRPSERSRE